MKLIVPSFADILPPSEFRGCASADTMWHSMNEQVLCVFVSSFLKDFLSSFLQLRECGLSAKVACDQLRRLACLFITSRNLHRPRCYQGFNVLFCLLSICILKTDHTLTHTSERLS